MERIFKFGQLLIVSYLLFALATADIPQNEKDLDELIKDIFQIPNDETTTIQAPYPPTPPPTRFPDTPYYPSSTTTLTPIPNTPTNDANVGDNNQITN